MNRHKAAPRWLISLIRLFIRRDYQENIEGDLLELYHRNSAEHGTASANRRLMKEVVLLFRWNLISLHSTNKNSFNMKSALLLAAICTVLLSGIMLPYLPGTYSAAAIITSGVAQAVGFFGLVLVPIGIAGLAVIRLNKVRGNVDPNKTDGHALAITALVLGIIIYATINIALFIGGNMKAGILVLIIGLITGYRFFLRLKKDVFNARRQRVFLYFIFVPLVALFGRKILAFELADVARQKTIQQANVWINEIEKYKLTTGEYPESISEMGTALPSPRYMGIRNFNYQKTNDNYNLSFVQWVDMGALQELVVYNNKGNYNVKGHFASHNAKSENWKYFWLD